MLIRDGIVVGESVCAPLVGLQHMAHAAPRVGRVQLQRLDRVLFYTDGLVEGGRRGGPRFGADHSATCCRVRHSQGLARAETVRQLGRKVLEHADYELNDDATMLLVEWRGIPPAQPASRKRSI